MSKYSGIFAITSAMQNSAAGKWYGRPCAPTVGSVTVTANTASVPVTASANTNGSTTVSYTATSNTGISNTSSSSPVSVPGLTKNTAYTFTVVTNSNLGSSASSSASNSILAQGVPNAPTIGTATATGTSASVAFTAPTCNGGSAITGYTAVANTGGFSGTNTTSPVTVSGLTGGASYTFIVYATNGIGNSANSSPSNSVFAATTPGIPTSVSASATSSSAISVSFTAPACNGGASIDYYQAVCTATGTNSATGTSPISVTGLSAGTSYTFKVRAHNSQGYGSYSSSTGTATTNVARGCQVYVGGTGNYTFTYPTGVTSVSMVLAGPGGNGGCAYSCTNVCYGATEWRAGGGGWGGGLAYTNNVTGTAGSSTLPVETGSANGGAQRSCCRRTIGVRRPPFTCVYYWIHETGSVGEFYGTSQSRGCGSRQVGGYGGCPRYRAGGAGGGNAGYTCIAGGSCSISYTGYPGIGGQPVCHPAGYAGTFGGAGGGSAVSASSTESGGGGGGGVSLYGRGSNGSGASAGGNGGGGGSGGSSGAAASGLNGGNGGSYGGGGGGGGATSGGGGSKGLGQNGAIRIIWPGNTRTFPSTDVGSP